MDKEQTKQLLQQIRDNQKRLDECSKHKFAAFDVPMQLKQKLTCLRCGGKLDAIRAKYYVDGYEAAGGNPNEIIEGYR